MAKQQNGNALEQIKSLLKTQQRQQNKQTAKLVRRRRWLTWIGAVILVILLFLIFANGYATNWWLNPIRTSSTTPESLTSNASGIDTQTGTTTSGTDKTTTNSEKVTNNTTNSTTSTDTDNSTKASQSLPDLAKELQLGSNIDTVIAEAKSRGVDVDCSNALIVVQECKFTDGTGASFTTRNLISDGLVSGIDLTQLQ